MPSPTKICNYTLWNEMNPLDIIWEPFLWLRCILPVSSFHSQNAKKTMAAIWVFSFTVEWNYLFLTILQNKIWKFFLAYVVIGPSSYGRLKMPTKLLTYYLTFLSQNCDLMGVFLHCIVLYCFSIFDTCIHFNKMTGFPWQGLHVWQLSRTTSMKNKWPTLWKQEILATLLLSIHA